VPMRVTVLVHDHPAGFGEQVSIFHQTGEHFIATWDRAPANPERISEAGIALTFRLGIGWRPHRQNGQTDSRSHNSPHAAGHFVLAGFSAGMRTRPAKFSFLDVTLTASPRSNNDTPLADEVSMTVAQQWIKNSEVPCSMRLGLVRRRYGS